MKKYILGATLFLSLAPALVSAQSVPTISISHLFEWDNTYSRTLEINSRVSGDVVGVQYMLDGINFGSEYITPPFRLSTSTSVRVVTDGTHIVTARARNSAGNISFSNSLPVIIDRTSPIPSSITVSSLTSTSAVITWTTSETALTKVEFGTTTSYGRFTPTRSAFATSHSHLLPNLTPATLYHYRTYSMDAAYNGLQTSDPDKTFTTATVGTTATTPPGATSTRPSITVTSPALGDTLRPGQPYTIRWSSRNLPSNARLYITIMNGTRGTISDPNTTIVTGLPASATSYIWQEVSPNNTGWGVGMASPLQRLARLFGNIAYAAGDPDQYIIGVGANLGEGTEEIAYATSSIFRISSTPSTGATTIVGTPSITWNSTIRDARIVAGNLLGTIPERTRLTISWTFNNARSCDIQYNKDGEGWITAAAGTTTSPGSFSNFTLPVGRYILRATCDGRQMPNILSHVVTPASTGATSEPSISWTEIPRQEPVNGVYYSNRGAPFTIQWDFNNARSCDIQSSMDDVEWITVAAATTTSSGSFSDITPATGTYLLRAVCNGLTMSNTLKHTVVPSMTPIVNPVGGSVTSTISSASIAWGDSSSGTTTPGTTFTIRWNISNARTNSSCSIDYQKASWNRPFGVWIDSGLSGTNGVHSQEYTLDARYIGIYRFRAKCDGQILPNTMMHAVVESRGSFGSFASDDPLTTTQGVTGAYGGLPPRILIFRERPEGAPTTTYTGQSFDLEWTATAASSCAIDYAVRNGASRDPSPLWQSWQTGLGTNSRITVPALSNPVALDIRLTCAAAQEGLVSAVKELFHQVIANTARANITNAPPVVSAPAAPTSCPVAQAPVSCNQDLTAYGVPVGATSGQASYTLDSCDNNRIVYTGGCSAPTTVSAPTAQTSCSVVEQPTTVLCSRYAGTISGVDYGIPSGHTEGNARYSIDSCNNNRIWYISGCSAPTPASTPAAPTSCPVEQPTTVLCSQFAGTISGVDYGIPSGHTEGNARYSIDSCNNNKIWYTRGCSAPVTMNSRNGNASQVAGAASTIGGLFGAASQSNTSFRYTWNRDLQIGSPYTNDIVALQTALTHEGVYAGDITGGFYDQTYLAVKKFQRKYGIESTGFVGTQTRTKLNELYGG